MTGGYRCTTEKKNCNLLARCRVLATGLPRRCISSTKFTTALSQLPDVSGF